MRDQPKGSEEPGDQILDRSAADTPADASSAGLGRTLDQETDVAGGRWAAPTADGAPADTARPVRPDDS